MSERRVAIVTGASSGIGRALAERAVRAGWNVLGVGRRAARLAELAELLRGATGTFASLALDLRSTGAPARIVREAQDRFGRIDVLVNNAGGVAVGPITNQSDDALYEQFETHAIVPLALTREAIPALRATKGHVFYVGSGVARIPVGTLGAYPPAKAAVRNMARIARNELRADDIAVTYIDPGAVATEFMTRAGFAGPPPNLAAAPEEVARRIFAAFTSRRQVVNAVPWQTFFVAVGEALPALTDAILRRAPQLVGGSTDATTALPGTETLEPDEADDDDTISPKVVAHVALPSHTSLATQASPGASQPQAPGGQLSATSRPGGSPSAPAPAATPQSVPAAAAAVSAVSTPAFDAALVLVNGRMQKLKLGAPFVRALLVPGATLELSDVAMRWAGMPNKHERAVTREVLEALADSGFLERSSDDSYVVLRKA